MAGAHQLADFDDDLNEVRALVSEAGGLVETAIYEAIEALLQHDEDVASKAITAIGRIEQQTREIERQCIRLIALRAPMGNNLRAVLASLQISVLVERIGHSASIVAEQAGIIAGHEHRAALRLVQSTALAVRDIVKSCLDAYASVDPQKAASVCDGRDMVGALNRQLINSLLETAADSPSRLSSSGGLLLVSQKLDRIGDDAAEIGKLVYFSATGDQPCPPWPCGHGHEARN